MPQLYIPEQMTYYSVFTAQLADQFRKNCFSCKFYFYNAGMQQQPGWVMSSQHYPCGMSHLCVVHRAISPAMAMLNSSCVLGDLGRHTESIMTHYQI